MRIVKKYRLFLMTILLVQSVSSAVPWEQFHGGTSHSGVWDGDIVVDNIILQWEFSPVNEAENNGSLTINAFDNQSQPCVSSDGKTIFAFGYTGTAADSQGQIVAINAEDGKMLWVTTVYAYTEMDSFSSPVYASGYLYWIGSKSNEKAFIYKINAENGSTSETDGGWIREIENESIVNASPLVVDDKLFFSTYSEFMSYNAHHYALDISDGSTLWSNTSAGGQGQGTMVYYAEKGLVFQTTFIDSVQNLTAFDLSTGAVISTSGALDSAPFQTAISLINGKLYFQDYSFYGDGGIYSFDPDNISNPLWQAETSGSGNSCPVVDSNGISYTCSGYSGAGNTQAYSASGSVLWTFEKAGGWSTSPALAGGYLFVGAQNSDTLYILDTSHSANTSGFIATTLAGHGPVAFGDKSFYTYSYGDNSKLYAYTTGTTSNVNVNLTMAVFPENSGTLSPVAGTSEVKQYEDISISASAADGYVFTGWTISGNGSISDSDSQETTVRLIGDSTITANFTQSDTEAQLTVSSDEGGSVSPEGMKTVMIGAETSINASADSGYYFIKWNVSKDSASIGNIYSSDTDITINENTAVTALFEKSDTGSGEGSKPAKLRVTINSGKPDKDKIIAKNLPLSEDLAVIESNVDIIIGGYEFTGLDMGDEKNGKYKYSSSSPKIKVIIDTRKHLWSFTAGKMSAGLSGFDFESGINVVLKIGENTYGANYVSQEFAKWKYKVGKSGTSSTDSSDETMKLFSVSKASGKYKDDTESITESFTVSGQYELSGGNSFNSQTDSVTIEVGGKVIQINAGDPLMKETREGIYRFIDKENGVTFQLDSIRGNWSLKQKKSTVNQAAVSPTDGIEITLTLGEDTGNETLSVDYSIVLKYSQKN